MSSQRTYDQTEETENSGVLELLTRKPVVTIGLSGLIASCGYGYWRYKTRGYLVSPSLFLMQLRVGAQGAVVGVVMIGMLHNMLTKMMEKKSDK